MKKIKIKVTQADIDKGKRRNACECAISQAAKREYPEAKNIRTCTSWFEFDGHVFDLSAPASRFICDFDSGKPVKPQNFIFKVRD